MARRASTGAAVAAVALLGLAAASQAPLQAAAGSFSVWRAPAGLITAAFVSGTGYAVVGTASFDRSTRKTRSRVVLVDARSARAIWSVEYRNSNCCGTPAIGVLPTNRKIFASGDELLLVPLSGGPSRRVELDGVTLDAATADGRVLAGVVLVRPGAMEHEVVALQANGVRWRARHPNLMAVALSADGLAAASGPQGVAIFGASTGRPLYQVPLPGTRFADLAFARNGLLVVAQKTTAGDLRLLGIDARTGRGLWSAALGPTTVPAVGIAGRMIVVSDFRGRVAAVVSPSGVVQDLWTDARGPVFVAGSPQGEIAVSIGPNVAVRTPTGRVRWRGAIPGTVLGLQLDGPWLAAVGTTDQKSNVPDRIWFVRTGQPTARR